MRVISSRGFSWFPTYGPALCCQHFLCFILRNRSIQMTVVHVSKACGSSWIKLNKKRNETNLKISGSLVELIMNSFFFRNLLSRALEFYGQLGHICSFEQLFIYLFFYCFGAWYSAPAVSTHSDNHN